MPFVPVVRPDDPPHFPTRQFPVAHNYTRTQIRSKARSLANLLQHSDQRPHFYISSDGHDWFEWEPKACTVPHAARWVICSLFWNTNRSVLWSVRGWKQEYGYVNAASGITPTSRKNSNWGKFVGAEREILHRLRAV